MKILICAISMLLISACAAPTPVIRGPGAQPPTPTPAPPAAIRNAEEAIAAAQAKFPELKNIKVTPPQTIGASTNITVMDSADGWNLVFWQGSGDCPAGCIDNHYWYVTVDKTGPVTLAGEFVREYNSATNTTQTRGQAMWGIPK